MPLNSSVDATTSFQSGHRFEQDAELDPGVLVQRHEVSKRPQLERRHRLAAHPVPADLRVRVEGGFGQAVGEDVCRVQPVEPGLLDRVDAGGFA